MPILPESSAARVSLFFNFINFFLSFLFEKDFKNYFFFLLYFLFLVVTALSIKIRRTSKRYEAEGEHSLCQEDSSEAGWANGSRRGRRHGLHIR